MKRPLNIIVAVDGSGGFGKQGRIPWNLPEDLKRFKQLTTGHICIMGRYTYEDILDGRKKRDLTKSGDTTKNEIVAPINEILRGRESYVVTNTKDYTPIGAKIGPNIRSIVFNIPDDDKRSVFIIGGRKMFIDALTWHPTIYLTVLKNEKGFDCDTFFPMEALKDYFVSKGEQDTNAYYLTYMHNKYKNK